jgi:hypothetical protein
VVTASDDKTARLRDAKTGKPVGEAMRHKDSVTVVSDNKHLLSALAEAVAGSAISELGAVEALEDQIGKLNKLRHQTANAPLGEPTAESFIRWFLSDPWTRTISPLSKLTVPEYIEQEIAPGRRR